MLLYVATAHVVPWSFTTCRLQIALRCGMVAPKLRRWVIDGFSRFSRFWSFPFSFSICLSKGFKIVRCVALAPGSGFGAGFWASELRRAEMRWEELRSAEKMWEDVRRAEKSFADVGRGEKRWEDMRWADMSCEELRRAEISWGEMRWDELRGPDMRRAVKKGVETSCIEWREAEGSWKEKKSDELRRDEKSSDDMRRDESSCDMLRYVVINWEELRWGEKTWDEIIWDRTPDCGDNGMQWANSKRSCDAMRSGEMRKDPTFTRDGTGMNSQEIVAAMYRRLGRTL